MVKVPTKTWLFLFFWTNIHAWHWVSKKVLEEAKQKGNFDYIDWLIAVAEIITSLSRRFFVTWLCNIYLLESQANPKVGS